MIGKKIKVCKDRENASLMLYHNIWRKNVIQISYKGHKFSVCFISCQSYTICFRRIKIIQKHIDTYYTSIFKYKLFILIIH